MDILIKRMEMPVDHGIFIVICPSGTIEQKVGNADNGYPIYHIVKDAKAVALPEHHGRLIDADALLPKSGYDPMMFKHKYDGDHRTQYDTLMGYEILGIVEDAPTIVEATE